MRLKNPIIPGFHPDPSICRAEEDYYLVTSSFEYFPGVPLFHSRDLVNWQQIGHCLTRENQLLLKKVGSSEGIYAPTIRYHSGAFYMTTTNTTRGGNFYVSTRNPRSEWSDPVWVDQGGIDPSLFFDDDGRVYFTSTATGGVTQDRAFTENGIVQSEIDLATGQCLTGTRYIWMGTGGQYPEAPHLYKINGHYYLMIAEGGTEYGHMVTIARSNTPWGPFESCPHNPILTHRSYLSPIQATGHADLVQAHDGSWWMVFLAVRPHGYPPAYHLGRETFLAPVRWTMDGWPIVGQDGRVAPEMEVAGMSAHPLPIEPTRDDFDQPVLAPCWSFLRNPCAGDWSLVDRLGWLRLTGSAVSLDDADAPAWIGRRQQHFDCRVATLLDYEPRNDIEEAGLTERMNERHHYEIAVTRLHLRRAVIVRRRIGSLAAVVARAYIGSRPVRLEIRADRAAYSFWYAVGDHALTRLAEGETRYLTTEVAGGFTGVYLAMYASGNGRSDTAPAYFDWFEYHAS